ncbi:MAG TPA: aminomethyl-transferring glycine dehydrogenase subunit GcvPB [Thermoanaerobaculia bacterium]|nr:aminomethyl-transferring glycine dehydrogenase subunit GcvPB [Thermoanaerobaculia bacterium]
MSDTPTDRRVPQVAWRNEPLLFERSSLGRIGVTVPAAGVEERPLDELLPEGLLRGEIDDLPELSEVDVVRHFTRISRKNYSLDLGLYPLGSCTMKYNPRINEEVARLPGFAASHPMQPASTVQGNLELFWQLERALIALTGLSRVSLHPAAGAHGEFAGIVMARAALDRRGEARKYVLIPDSAHGTNPASARFAGFEVKELLSNERGTLDLADLERAMTDEVAALMLTVPNTLGVFEDQIKKIAEIVHGKGGFLYCDGANFNAFVGKARPGDMGIDVLHMNLHKTFTTPHGGGGPGAGPVGVADELVPFLPVPTVERGDGGFYLDFDRPDSIGRIRSFHGQFGMLVRALTYILSMGGEGLAQVAENAVLNANYVRKGLEGTYHLPYRSPSMHEVVFSDKVQHEHGVSTLDVAKRLMDYGFHPPTIYFPLIVAGALMIEPTETVGKNELDGFVEAMVAIAREAEEDPELVKGAPYTTPVRRCDEARAARHPVLRWKPSSGSSAESSAE